MWLLLLTTRLLRCEMCVGVESWRGCCRVDTAVLQCCSAAVLQCNCYQATCRHALQLGGVDRGLKCQMLIFCFEFSILGI